MDLNLLKTFVKVADCASLTKASKVLKCPKSKISRDLVKLEASLEQTLLKRSARGIKLTEYGFNFLQATRSQLEALETSIESVKTIPNKIQGNLRITAPEDLSSFILTRLMGDFIDLYPDVRVELLSTTEFMDFKENNIDLALRIGKLESSSLIQKKISEIEVIFVVSREYLKANQKIESWKDLNEHRLGVISDIQGNLLNKDKTEVLKSKFLSNSMTALKNFVSLHKGVATLPYFFCREELRSKEFIRVLPQKSYMKRNLFLLSPASSFTPKHVKVFKDFIFEALEKEI